MTAGRTSTQNKQDWNTPIKYVEAIYSFYGRPYLDPCSNMDSIVDAHIEWYLPTTDGLSETWEYPTIFINPPFGRDMKRKTTIKNWIKKAWESHCIFDSEILVLIPVAVNTRHWKEYIFGKAHICFLSDTRLKFRINGSEENKGAPMPCAMIYYGNNFDKFKRVFSEYGYVTN